MFQSKSVAIVQIERKFSSENAVMGKTMMKKGKMVVFKAVKQEAH